MIPSSFRASSSTTDLTLPKSDHISRQHSSNSIPNDAGIRPRNRRLETMVRSQLGKSATSTPSSSRTSSPMPPTNHSPKAEKKRHLRNGRENFIEESESVRSGTSKKSAWDGSWAIQGLNALQEIAFSMMAGDNHTEEGRNFGRPGLNQKKEGWFTTSTKKGNIQSSWGPESSLPQHKDARIGIGDAREREEKLKEKKKARVLEGRDSGTSTVDSAGNYKRRTSIEETMPSGLEEDDYTLVYVYHVQPQDTLQGVVLKFHSQMEIFKKANRLWAGDSIQIRKKVYLPVDACAIKGKPCPAPSSDASLEVNIIAQTSGRDHSAFANTDTCLNSTSAERPEQNETHWAHIRWVLIDSLPSNPVEIVRVPRKTLNYFPPRRRKSIANTSDFSSPRVSLDLPVYSRSSIDSQTSSASQKILASSHRPSQLCTTSSGPPLSPQSITSSLDRHEPIKNAADRLGWLRGPGGVGTLGKNVRKPGPAKDALNSWTSKRFPSIAIDSLPSTSTISAENIQMNLNNEEMENIVTGSAIAATYSGSSTGGLSFPNVNLNGVESWVRKLATKVQVSGKMRGDTIEMLDGAGSDDGRGFDFAAGSSFAERNFKGRRNDHETSVRERGKSAKSE